MNQHPEFLLYNTLTRKKERFEPLDPANVRLYVCGPTVYDYAHIGNARPIIVFDVLFRLLRHLYGAEHVTYVRNITDVDDKINARAAQEGVSIEDVTRRTTEQFHKDIAALGVLEPTVEPRATDHIEEMKIMIERLLESDHAYRADDHVLFDVTSMKDYGELSGQPLDQIVAGARIEKADYKKNPADFVLWKPSKPGEPSWSSPGGIATKGRPGWHIECSAMAGKYLGTVFDIHGGGIDLTFPHHENEVAQSRCAHGTDTMANVWMHNGFVQVEGEKMSKSLGNFITIHELLETPKFGGRNWDGNVLRLAMLTSNYRRPIDLTVEQLEKANSKIKRWKRLIAEVPETEFQEPEVHPKILAYLMNDLDTPACTRLMDEFYLDAKGANFSGGEYEPMTDFHSDPSRKKSVGYLFGAAQFLGINLPREYVTVAETGTLHIQGNEAPLYDPEKAKYAAQSNTAIDIIKAPENINSLIESRNHFLVQKNFTGADQIRDELLKDGIQLMDTKDPVTGERKAKWETK